MSAVSDAGGWSRFGRSSAVAMDVVFGVVLLQRAVAGAGFGGSSGERRGFWRLALGSRGGGLRAHGVEVLWPVHGDRATEITERVPDGPKHYLSPAFYERDLIAFG